MAMARIAGTRLAYVVVPLQGTVTRSICVMERHEAGRNKDGSKRYMHTMKRQLIERPAGFMVYFPRGHCLRLPDTAALKRYGLDKAPRLISLSGLADKNSALGRLMTAQDDDARRNVMEDLRKQVIRLATVKSGPNVLTRVERIEEAA